MSKTLDFKVEVTVDGGGLALVTRTSPMSRAAAIKLYNETEVFGSAVKWLIETDTVRAATNRHGERVRETIPGTIDA